MNYISIKLYFFLKREHIKTFGDSGLVWCGSSGIGESGSNLKAEATEFAARSNKRCERKELPEMSTRLCGQATSALCKIMLKHCPLDFPMSIFYKISI